MSLVTASIPNLVNGVSQQPFMLRLASQGEEQVNGFSSVVDGLRKRPPTQHRARLTSTPSLGAFTHTINRDTSERYEVLIMGGNLRVFRLDGTEVAVSFPNGKTYLASLTPAEDFAAVTVADYTFIVNKTKKVATLPTKITKRPQEAIYWVRQGAYSTKYTIKVGSVTATFTTPNGSETDEVEQIATTYIATKLRDALVAGLAAGFTVQLFGSVIYVSHPTTTFTSEVSDGIGDTALKMVRQTVQRFSDLPTKCKDGFLVEVAGTSEDDFDSYYVRYTADSDNPRGGIWKEAALDDELYQIDRSTMPHGLVRVPDGTFQFKALSWEDRAVGSLETTPFPSFVDKKIGDIFFHRNRLGILAQESVVFSQAGEFFDFYPSSAIQTVDTDPIDVSVSHVKVSNLRHAIPFAESLLLFSDQTQFILGRSDLLTPKTISINPTTEFECSLRAKPVGAGQNVYFPIQRGQFSGLREYYVDGENQQNDAAEVTSHCLRYVPAGVFKLAASSNEDCVIALSDQAPNRLYVYRYYWSGADKLQSAWSHWELDADATILNADFIESDLWLVISRPDGTYLEVVSLEAGRVDPGLDFQFHLDRRLSAAQCVVTYDAPANKTRVKLPFGTPTANLQFVTGAADAENRPGRILSFTTISSDTFDLKGHVTDFYVGQRYVFRYRFSTLVLREQKQGGEQAIGSGRLQLRNMRLAYSQTGYFRVEVTPFARDTFTYVFGGRLLGSARAPIGEVAIETGGFKFPIMSKNDQVVIDLINDSPLPCAFLSAEWEGFFVTRARRL